MEYVLRKKVVQIFVVMIQLAVASVWILTALPCKAAAETKGAFYLVGMGPGDPDLATLRAVRIVEKADLIICHENLKKRFPDLLKDKNVLAQPGGRIWFGYGRKASEFEGKELELFVAGQKARGQVISSVRKAFEDGKTAALLVSGDPLIYGPGVWCLEEFRDLDPIVVPGLSCFNVANAALRKDVTYSETSKSTILTADDWPGKRDTIETLSSHQVSMVVFTMGFELKRLVSKLSTHYPPRTPVAIVCHAGYKEKEYVIKATLGTILDKIGDEVLPFEHLVYVGENLQVQCKKYNSEN